MSEKRNKLIISKLVGLSVCLSCLMNAKANQGRGGERALTLEYANLKMKPSSKTNKT